jgi:hypothetical protein
MSESQTVAVNLVESVTFTEEVKCQVPGTTPKSWRELKFDATFKVLDEDEQEALPITATQRDVLREVLQEVKGIPGATLADGTKLSPVEVCIRNPFTSDACYAVYQLVQKKNTRDLNAAAAMSGLQKGNSKRSRPQ